MEPTEVEDLVSDQPTPISDSDLAHVRLALETTTDPALLFGRKCVGKLIARLDAAEAECERLTAALRAARTELVDTEQAGFPHAAVVRAALILDDAIGADQ